MGRKSSIDKLPKDVRSHIERSLRENRLTLDELIADLQARFPGKDTPSRSAVGRYKVSFDHMVRRMREQEAMSRLLVAELGENPDERAGQLMVQSVTTLVNHAAFAAQNEEDVDIEGVRKLARAAKDVLQARKASLEERRTIEREAREKLIEEQRGKLDELGRTGQIDQAVLDKVIKAAYGL